jgi:hypothetical protein
MALLQRGFYAAACEASARMLPSRLGWGKALWHRKPVSRPCKSKSDSPGSDLVRETHCSGPTSNAKAKVGRKGQRLPICYRRTAAACTYKCDFLHDVTILCGLNPWLSRRAAFARRLPPGAASAPCWRSECSRQPRPCGVESSLGRGLLHRRVSPRVEGFPPRLEGFHRAQKGFSHT